MRCLRTYPREGEGSCFGLSSVKPAQGFLPVSPGLKERNVQVRWLCLLADLPDGEEELLFYNLCKLRYVFVYKLGYSGQLKVE